MITNMIIGPVIGSVSIGSNVNQPLVATLTSTGTGEGVSTLRMQVSEDQTFEITSGTARFYTDAAGTLGESTTWNVTAGTLRTIYLKCPTGTANLTIPEPKKVIKFGEFPNEGYVSTTNSPLLTINLENTSLTTIRISAGVKILGKMPDSVGYLRIVNSEWIYTGALPTSVYLLYLSSNLIKWEYSGAFPNGTNYVYIIGDNINWTGLDIGNNGNISSFSLTNYRITKMSSPEMVTLLTQLTNRTGTLPATITINDYADALAPPQSVTDAVAALKLAKSITTVNLGV